MKNKILSTKNNCQSHCRSGYWQPSNVGHDSPYPIEVVEAAADAVVDSSQQPPSVINSPKNSSSQ